MTSGPGERLLATEGFDGVGDGCADRLEADGDQGNEDGGGTGGHENPPADADPIGEALEPQVHPPPGDREGKQGCDENESGEIYGKQLHDAADPGAQNLADAYLFHPLLCGIGNETEKTEAG